MKTLAAIVVGIFLPGGVLILAVNAWLKRRAALRDAEILSELITPPVQTFGKLSTADTEAMRVEASRRRAAAEYQAKKSAQIASGEPGDDRIIRVVGGRR